MSAPGFQFKAGGIFVGDTVMVVRGHACMLRDMGGIPFVVRRLIVDPRIVRYCCVDCHDYNIQGPPSYVVHSTFSIPTSWLKKFDAPIRQEEIIRKIEQPA